MRTADRRIETQPIFAHAHNRSRSPKMHLIRLVVLWDMCAWILLYVPLEKPAGPVDNTQPTLAEVHGKSIQEGGGRGE